MKIVICEHRNINEYRAAKMKLGLRTIENLWTIEEAAT